MAPAAPVDRGFTLTEVLVAMTCLTVLAAGAASLSLLALGTVRTARDETTAVALALRRMEQLKADPVDDAWTAGPADALVHDASGYVDYFGAMGEFLGTGDAPPPAAAFVCRWQVAAWPGDPDDLLVLQVRVTTASADRAASAAGDETGSAPGDVQLTGFRRREWP